MNQEDGARELHACRARPSTRGIDRTRCRRKSLSFPEEEWTELHEGTRRWRGTSSCHSWRPSREGTATGGIEFLFAHSFLHMEVRRRLSQGRAIGRLVHTMREPIRVFDQMSCPIARIQVIVILTTCAVDWCGRPQSAPRRIRSCRSRAVQVCAA